MIGDLPRKFPKYEKQIRDFALLRKSDYFGSNCFKVLNSRYETLRDSNNMDFSKTGATMSKMSFALVKEQMLLRRAVTKQNFRNEPLFSVEPVGDTPRQNALNIQDVVNLNGKRTRFRRKCLDPIIDLTSKFGVGVAYCDPREDKGEHFMTVPVDGFPGMTQRQRVPYSRKGVHHRQIHFLNYFQDPSVLDAEYSDYQGHIQRWHLHELQLLLSSKDSRYMLDNLAAALKNARDSLPDEDYHEENTSDDAKYAVDVVHMFTTLPIRGNEDDDTIYYLEIVDDTIIRFQAEIYDQKVRPYQIFTFDKHIDYWWGNADAEYRIPHENATNMLLGLALDNVINSTKIIRLYDPNVINIKDIQNRHRTQGFVPADFKKMIGQRAFQQEQSVDNSNNSVQFIMSYINENMQRNSTKTDFGRKETAGGPQNSTAFAASLLQGQADMLDADLLEQFSYALETLGEKDAILLQQFLSDYIRIRSNSKEQPRELNKAEILGMFDFSIKTSLQKNILSESTRIQNALTQLINMGNVRPELQNMKIVDAVRDWIKTLDIGDPDIILPQEAKQPAMPGGMPAQVPGVPAPAMAPQQPQMQGVA